MGQMSVFKPDFSLGTADYQYDYALITYSDESTEKVENILYSDAENYKQIAQELQLTYIATTVKKYGDKNIFMSDTLSCKATKLLLAPSTDRYITKIEYLRNNDSVKVSFWDESFVRWSILTTGYYRTISITNKPTDLNPYEVTVHRLDLNYNMNNEDHKLSTEHKVPSHFNQIKYTNLVSYGEVSGNPGNIADEVSSESDALTYRYPSFGNVRITEHFAKFFKGFSNTGEARSTIAHSLINVTIDPAQDWAYDFGSGIDLQQLDCTDDIFTLDDSNILTFSKDQFESAKTLSRVLYFAYVSATGKNAGIIEMHIEFELRINLITDSYSTVLGLTEPGWYPLPWNEQLNKLSKAYVDLAELAVTGEEGITFDSNRLLVYFPMTDSEIHTLKLTANHAALTLDGEDVDSVSFTYQFLESVDYTRNLAVVLKDATTAYGVLSSEAMNGSENVILNSIDYSDIRYAGKEAISYIRSNVVTERNKIYDYSGTYNGASFDKIIDSNNGIINYADGNFAFWENYVGTSTFEFSSIAPVSSKICYFSDGEDLYRMTDGVHSHTQSLGLSNKWPSNICSARVHEASVEDYIWVVAVIREQDTSTSATYYLKTWVYTEGYPELVKEEKIELFHTSASLISYHGMYVYINAPSEPPYRGAQVIVAVTKQSMISSSRTVEYHIGTLSNKTLTVQIEKVDSYSLEPDDPDYLPNIGFYPEGNTYGFIAGFSDSGYNKYFKGNYETGTYQYVDCTNSFKIQNGYLNFFNTSDDRLFVLVSEKRNAPSNNAIRYLYTSETGNPDDWQFVAEFVTPKPYTRAVYYDGVYFIYNKYFYRSAENSKWIVRDLAGEWNFLDHAHEMPLDDDMVASAGSMLEGSTTKYFHGFALLWVRRLTGLTFTDSNEVPVVAETAISGELNNNVFTIDSPSGTSLLNLPKKIPDSMGTYGRIPSLYNESRIFTNISKVTIPEYSYWNTSSSTLVTVPEYKGTPSRVELSSTSLVMDGTEYLNNSTWINTRGQFYCQITLIKAVVAEGRLRFSIPGNNHYFITEQLDEVPNGNTYLCGCLLGIDDGNDFLDSRYPGNILDVYLRHPVLKACRASRLNSYEKDRETDPVRDMSYILIYTLDPEINPYKYYGNYLMYVTTTLFGKRGYNVSISDKAVQWYLGSQAMTQIKELLSSTGEIDQVYDRYSGTVGDKSYSKLIYATNPIPKTLALDQVANINFTGLQAVSFGGDTIYASRYNGLNSYTYMRTTDRGTNWTILDDWAPTAIGSNPPAIMDSCEMAGRLFISYPIFESYYDDLAFRILDTDESSINRYMHTNLAPSLQKGAAAAFLTPNTFYKYDPLPGTTPYGSVIEVYGASDIPTHIDILTFYGTQANSVNSINWNATGGTYSITYLTTDTDHKLAVATCLDTDSNSTYMVYSARDQQFSEKSWPSEIADCERITFFHPEHSTPIMACYNPTNARAYIYTSATLEPDDWELIAKVPTMGRFFIDVIYYNGAYIFGDQYAFKQKDKWTVADPPTETSWSSVWGKGSLYGTDYHTVRAVNGNVFSYRISADFYKGLSFLDSSDNVVTTESEFPQETTKTELKLIQDGATTLIDLPKEASYVIS